MRQDNSPWGKSYQYLKMQRRREDERSEKQKAKTKEWGDGFHIAGDKSEQTPIDGADKLVEKRRQVDEVLEDQRDRDAMKEVWE